MMRLYWCPRTYAILCQASAEAEDEAFVRKGLATYNKCLSLFQSPKLLKFQSTQSPLL